MYTPVMYDFTTEDRYHPVDRARGSVEKEIDAHRALFLFCQK
jgi:hypothetical protein